MSEFGYFLDALICGPKATVEYFINGANCMYAEHLCAKAARKNKDIKVVDSEAAEAEEVKPVKAEIVEFSREVEKFRSAINAKFSTADEDEDINTTLTEDQTSNYIEDIVEKVTTNSELNLDSEKDINDIKLTTLAVLLAIGKTKYTSKISTEYIKTRDDVIELNTIYKYFTKIKYFAKESAIQLNEVITTQLLYDTVVAIYESEDFSEDEVMTNILAKTKKRLEKEAISNAALTDSDVDPVTPVVFNQGILGSAFNSKYPKVAKTTSEYILNYITSILPEDWIRENSITFELSPKQDMVDPNKDTGMAILTVKLFGEIMKQFPVDLDTITGNGYGLGIYTYLPGYQQPQILFVSIEKFPNIIKNAIVRNFYTLNNSADPDSITEFMQVSSDTYGPEVYYRFDMSGMSKHLSFMTNEEKARFGNNLLWISAANWPNLGLGQTQYRMRVRNYKSPDKFTLVSDRNTRQQLPEMLPVFGEQYKKYFKDPDEDVVDSNILVCKFDSGKIEVSVNGSNISGMVLPKIEQPQGN